jgi:hypothetical protein
MRFMLTSTKQPGPPTMPRPAAAAQLSVQQQFSPQTLIAQLKIADAHAKIEALERKRGSRLICLTYNETIPQLAPVLAPPVIGALEQVLAEMGRVPKLDLMLRTTGGMTEVPWRIVCLLREFTDELGVIVSRFALSGGCHIALSADDLVMGPFSTLSSVDPTRQHPLLSRDPATGQPIPTSVQDLKHCILFIREQLGGSADTQIPETIISELFKYVNPLALGALEQSYALSRLITEKVLKTRKKTPLKPDQINNIVEMLSGRYFSHAFLISRGEVESDLGLPVTRPDDELNHLITDFESYYLPEFQKMEPVAAGAVDKLHIGGLLESTKSGHAIVQLVRPDGSLGFDPWVKFR